MVSTMKRIVEQVAFCVALLVATSCYVEARPAYGPADVIVTPAPVHVETYPYVFYDGGPVYWVEGRWYRRHGNGWVYYRNEPPFLSQRRPVTVAPPAYGPVPHGPPARGPAPPATIQAPPAR